MIMYVDYLYQKYIKMRKKLFKCLLFYMFVNLNIIKNKEEKL